MSTGHWSKTPTPIIGFQQWCWFRDELGRKSVLICTTNVVVISGILVKPRTALVGEWWSEGFEDLPDGNGPETETQSGKENRG